MRPRTIMTPLEKLQMAIDKCNDFRGCDHCCGATKQEHCEKLKAHRERMHYCATHDIPIELW